MCNCFPIHVQGIDVEQMHNKHTCEWRMAHICPCTDNSRFLVHAWLPCAGCMGGTPPADVAAYCSTSHGYTSYMDYGQASYAVHTLRFGCQSYKVRLYTRRYQSKEELGRQHRLGVRELRHIATHSNLRTRNRLGRQIDSGCLRSLPCTPEIRMRAKSNSRLTQRPLQ